MKQGEQEEHPANIQQHQFHFHQPTSNPQQHQYPTKSKNKNANEAETNAESTEFVFLRDNGSRLHMYLNSLT